MELINNQTAIKILNALTEEVRVNGIIDNFLVFKNSDIYLPVSVEIIEENIIIAGKCFDIVSVSNHFIRDGVLKFDPYVEFLINKDDGCVNVGVVLTNKNQNLDNHIFASQFLIDIERQQELIIETNTEGEGRIWKPKTELV